MAASKYDREPFCTVLDFRDGHPVVTHADRSMVTLSSRRERLLWGVVASPGLKSILLLYFGAFPIVTVAVLAGLLSRWVFFLAILVMLFLPFLLQLWRIPQHRRELRSRSRTSLDDFRSEGGLQGEPRRVVAAIRAALGRSYAIEPELIMPWDTRKSLYRLAVPYSFEVIVGAAHDLDVELSDADVDRIAKRIPSEAKSVRDMVQLLSEEFQKKKLTLSRPEGFDNA
jgi:hypothetical protein